MSSVEALAGSNVVEQLLEYILRRPDPMEMPCTCYLIVMKIRECTNLWTITTNGTNPQKQLVSMIWEVSIHSRQTIQVILQMSKSSQIFGSAKVNHKYGTFEANYYTV